MRQSEKVFVDSGAWIALALVRDALHSEAVDHWRRLRGAGARLHTSIPIVLETFTFLERNTNRNVALAWKDSIYLKGLVKVIACSNADLEGAWPYFQRSDMHKLSAVDATSFVLMQRLKISLAFAFDHHFAVAGFRLVG